MKIFLDILKDIATNGNAREKILKLTTEGLKYVEQAEKWLDSVEQDGDFDKITTVTNDCVKHLHESIANKFKTGELGEKELKQVHRLSMMFPSGLTDSLENFVKFFYDKYHK